MCDKMIIIPLLAILASCSVLAQDPTTTFPTRNTDKSATARYNRLQLNYQFTLQSVGASSIRKLANNFTHDR